MVGHEEQCFVIGGQELSLLHPELNRLQNQLKEKDDELDAAQCEITAFRSTEQIMKDKAVEELKGEVKRLDEKLRATENRLGQKNLEIKKLTNEKKDALAAQFAAEATLSRVYANQKDDEFLPLESFIAPLEAEIKMYKNEIASLQEDKKALERLTKSKESALLEAERILTSALERALIVDEVQNKNFELKRQIEICQEENKILEKTNRQKVLEVEKLSQTIQELEEAVLAGGAAANVIRDYKRQIEEINEEKRTLEREVARFKVSASRIANVVANEWKDENDKVMPIKQWLEERRLMQGEMQRLRDKLTVSERTAKAEAQLKEKLKLRLKILEAGLKQQVSSLSTNANAITASTKTEKASNILGFLISNGGVRKRSISNPRASTFSTSPLLQPTAELENVSSEAKQANCFEKKNASGGNVLKKSLWTSRSKVVHSGEKENTEIKANTNTGDDKKVPTELKTKENGNEEPKDRSDCEDMVSGFLYDRIQKEVINLRKLCEAKENYLNAKDHEIQMLTRKVDALTKAIEIESKRMKREAASREKEVASIKKEDNKKNRITSSSKRVTK